jgi:hypothetical protein
MDLRRSFDRCVDLFNTVIGEISHGDQNVNVSAFQGSAHRGRGNGGRGRGGRHDRRNDRRFTGRGYGGHSGGGRTFGRGGRTGRGGRGGRGVEISDRYYTNEEFHALGDAGRAQVQRLRDERDSKRSSTSTQSIASAVVAALRNTTPVAPPDAQVMEIEAPPATGTSNRTNPALNRTVRYPPQG